MNPNPRYLKPTLLQLVSLVIPAWIVRVTLHSNKSLPIELNDFRGVASDLAIAATWLLCSAVLFGSAKRLWIRCALAALFLIWGVLNLANFEHISVLDAPLEAGNARYLGNATFVAGSALSVSSPVLATTLLMIPALGAWFGGPLSDSRRGVVSRAVLIAMVAWVVTLVWPVSSGRSAWRDANFLHTGLERLQVGSLDSGPDSQRRVELPDLDGKPLIALEPRRHNVLIIMIEGVSGAFIPSLREKYGLSNVGPSMPKLDRLYKRAFSVQPFIANQRQTNRGEYSILCGDYPKLRSSTAKMFEYIQADAQRCLPGILKEQGYTTAYMQPSGLGFMHKDQFMDKAGFDIVYGSGKFTQGYTENGWGIDDMAFLEQSHGVLKELNAGQKPWFATVLTVGTHHPYLIPESFEKRRDETRREQSFRYADKALDKLIISLEESGILENTLVLITSDESAGASNLKNDTSRALTSNWGFLAALIPEQSQNEIVQTQPFSSADIAISVVDYLGKPNLSKFFGGRSIFRSYNDTRSVFFGNVYSHRVYEFGYDQTLIACDEDFSSSCEIYVLKHPHLMAKRRPQGAPTEERLKVLRTASEASLNRPAEPVLTQVIHLFPENRDSVIIPDGGRAFTVSGGQFLTLQPGDSIEIELELEVTGENAEVYLRHRLTSRSPTTIHKEPLAGSFKSGERTKVSYVFTADKKITGVEIGLKAQTLAGEEATLVVRRARATVRRNPEYIENDHAN